GQDRLDDRRRREDGLHRRRQGVRAPDQRVDPHPDRRDGRVGRLSPTQRDFRQLGFADPAAALANFESLAPTPRDAELLAPIAPRLTAALAAAPDPDMALNNLERYAAVVNRSVLYATLAQHPGALPLLVRVFGSSQFLADALRRRPQALAWLLEPRTMRVWLPEDLAADLAQALGPFETREARMKGLRRFKYRHLLRIGARDLLGDADLDVTTEELAHLADVCLAEALAFAEAAARVEYGAPLGAPGTETGVAVIAMGKLGGEELNYSSDIDLMFAYGADGETAGGRSDEGADRPDARGEGRRGDERQARPWRDPRDRVPRPGAPAPLWRRRLLAARAQHAEDDLSAVRARVPGARPRPDAVGGVRAPAHRGAPAADPPRVPDPHAALVAARARPARPTRRHRRAARAGGARVPGAPPADHHHRAPRVSRLLRRARRVPRQAPPIAQRHR